MVVSNVNFFQLPRVPTCPIDFIGCIQYRAGGSRYAPTVVPTYMWHYDNGRLVNLRRELFFAFINAARVILWARAKELANKFNSPCICTANNTNGTPRLCPHRQSHRAGEIHGRWKLQHVLLLFINSMNNKEIGCIRISNKRPTKTATIRHKLIISFAESIKAHTAVENYSNHSKGS